MSEKIDKRFSKIERNMKFVQALEDKLNRLEEHFKLCGSEGSKMGANAVIKQIRRVINEYVE